MVCLAEVWSMELWMAEKASVWVDMLKISGQSVFCCYSFFFCVFEQLLRYGVYMLCICYMTAMLVSWFRRGCELHGS